MSAKPLACPTCLDRPKAMRRWHDKHNRAANHLKWQVKCKSGCITSLGGYRAEAVTLFNCAVTEKREQMAAAAPRMTLRRFFSLVWHGVGGAR